MTRKTVNLNNLPDHVAQSIRSYQYDNQSRLQGDVLPLETAMMFYLHWEGVVGELPWIMSIVEAAE